jgi:hypothetical protein
VVLRLADGLITVDSAAPEGADGTRRPG